MELGGASPTRIGEMYIDKIRPVASRLTSQLPQIGLGSKCRVKRPVAARTRIQAHCMRDIPFVLPPLDVQGRDGHSGGHLYLPMGRTA